MIICKMLPFQRLQNPLQTWSVASLTGGWMACRMERSRGTMTKPGSRQVTRLAPEGVTDARPVP